MTVTLQRASKADHQAVPGEEGARDGAEAYVDRTSRTPSMEKLASHESADYEFREEDKVRAKTRRDAGLLDFLTDGDRQWLLYLSIVAFVVRLAFLNHPSVVIFDEVHFGGFAQKYLNREFFTDLHPPLARLLVTLSAWIGGFDGKFSFYDIGADYLKPGVPYVTMRAFTAVCGALVVPIAFVTMRAMRLTPYSALAISTMIVFENALTTQSRLILLDSYLVLFTTLVGLFWILFQRQSHRPFSWQWKTSLLGLGISMALAASCKWVGLFAVVAIGLYTIVDLWNILGDVRVSMKTVGRHLAYRSMALIVVPFVVYAATFWIHFALLSNSSPAAGGMTIEFQQTLKGGELPPTMKRVFYGSHVRIRQYRLEGGFLHSHAHFYPTGSKQQQVTGYHHRDPNNVWILRRPYVLNQTYVEDDAADEESELRPLLHGDELRLEHIATGRFLHSHPVDPPLSNKEKQHEVSAYGHHASNFSDTNDNWRIEIVDSAGRSITEEEEGEAKDPDRRRPPILAIGTKFRLVHRNLGCKLHCRNKALPEWGYKQSEVTCGRETLRLNQIWMIESNEHSAATAESHELILVPKKGFWGKFAELNRKMWATNAGLSAHHPFGSRPDSWPLLLRGIGFWNGNHVPKTEQQYRASKKNKEKKNVDSDDSAGEEADNKEDDADDSVADEAEQAERARLAQEYVKFQGQQVYLLGNPILWWSATAAIGIYVAMVLALRLAKRRSLPIVARIEASPLGKQLTYGSFAGFMFVQWLWHYLPFFGMHRQLFLHHYLPALYFSVLLLAILLDMALVGMGGLLRLAPEQARKARMLVLVALVVANIYVFWRLAPLGYGLRMSKTQCESLKWLKRWDFDCNSLVDPVSNIATS